MADALRLHMDPGETREYRVCWEVQLKDSDDEHLFWVVYSLPAASPGWAQQHVAEIRRQALSDDKVRNPQVQVRTISDWTVTG